MRKKQNRDSGGPNASQRQLRVGELVRHAIAEMLTRGDVHDPVIEAHMITIPEVAVTADLRLATVYVMPLGGKDAEAVVAAFDRPGALIGRASEGSNQCVYRDEYGRRYTAACPRGY